MYSNRKSILSFFTKPSQCQLSQTTIIEFHVFISSNSLICFGITN